MRFGRWRQDPQSALLVLTGLVGFVFLVYLVVVLGGGALIGQTDTPNVGLSVLATAIVALGFEPLQGKLEQLAAHWVRGGRPAPYDVLSRFSEAVSGPHQGSALPERMAEVLAEGTGAAWAQVWLDVNDRPVLAATAPPEAVVSVADPVPGGADPFGVRSLEVRRAGERLGVLRLQEREGVALTPVEERLFDELAGRAGLALHGVRLRAELDARVIELSARAEELRQSRERLVDAQDAERRRLERDIHDGAQQHLVALAVNLRLAQTLTARAPERAANVLSEQLDAADDAVETLVGLARGIYPSALTEHGLGEALRSAAGIGPAAVDVDDRLVGRYPPAVEAALYFCCLEALQNATKHSGARHVTLILDQRDGGIEVRVVDDGCGFDHEEVAGGAGLANMRDRIDSVGGSLQLVSTPGVGTEVVASVPVVRG